MEKKLEVHLMTAMGSHGSLSYDAVHTYPGDYTFEFPSPETGDCFIVIDADDSNVAFYPRHNVKFLLYVLPQIPTR